MTKSDLIMELAKKENISEIKVAKTVNLIFNGFTDILKHGGRIEIRGFGSFVVRNYK